MEKKQYHFMTDDLPSRDTFNTPRFHTISDYDGLEEILMTVILLRQKLM